MLLRSGPVFQTSINNGKYLTKMYLVLFHFLNIITQTHNIYYRYVLIQNILNIKINDILSFYHHFLTSIIYKYTYLPYSTRLYNYLFTYHNYVID